MKINDVLLQCPKCLTIYQPEVGEDAPLYCACPHVITGSAVFYERGGPKGIDTLYCRSCTEVLAMRYANDKEGKYAGYDDGMAEVDLIHPVCKTDWDVFRTQQI